MRPYLLRRLRGASDALEALQTVNVPACLITYLIHLFL
jgi:hypothetical protein